MDAPFDPPRLTRDQVCLIGLVHGHSMVSVVDDFGPSLEIFAAPKTKEILAYVQHAKSPTFAFDPFANPFTENAVDYFIHKNEKSVLTPGRQTWLYASWEASGKSHQHTWVRELIDYQDNACSRNPLLPKYMTYGLEIDESAKKKQSSYNLCRDPQSSDSLNSLCLNYARLPSDYAITNFTVWLKRKNIDWIEFNPPHPFGFYKIVVDNEGELMFLRNETSDNGLEARRRSFLEEDEIQEYELSPDMRKVSAYLENIPALCDHLNVPDFSSYLDAQPKITADLSKHIRLDTVIVDKDVSKKQRTFFKERFAPD